MVLERLRRVGREAVQNDEAVNVFWAGVVSAYHHALSGDIVGARRAADLATATSERTGFPWSTGAGHRMMAQVLVLQDGWVAAAQLTQRRRSRLFGLAVTTDRETG